MSNTSNIRDLLKGYPVLVMRPGHYPNKADIVSVMESWPNATVRTEYLKSHHTDNKTRFVVTVRMH